MQPQRTKRFCGSPEDRFWVKVVEAEPSDLSPNGWYGCWLWTGHKPDGYGRFKTERSSLAHRFAYEYVVGLIPAGLEIDHLCRRPCCVNPEHLETVTRYMNVQRGKDARGQRTQCRFGHDLTGANGYHYGGRIHCRTCRRTAKRSWRARTGRRG